MRYLFLLLLALPAMAGREFVAASSQFTSNSIPLTASTPITLSIFARPNINSTDIWAITILTSTNNHRHSLIAVGSVGGDPWYAQSFSTSAANTSGGGPFSTNDLTHVAGVFSATANRVLYVSGSPVSTNTNTRTLTAFDTIYLGKLVASGYWAGTLAEAAIWTAALTADEVRSLAAGAPAFMVRPASLLFYAPLTGQDTANDWEFVRGSLTLYNSPTDSELHPRIYKP